MGFLGRMLGTGAAEQIYFFVRWLSKNITFPLAKLMTSGHSTSFIKELSAF